MAAVFMDPDGAGCSELGAFWPRAWTKFCIAPQNENAWKVFQASCTQAPVSGLIPGSMSQNPRTGPRWYTRRGDQPRGARSIRRLLPKMFPFRALLNPGKSRRGTELLRPIWTVADGRRVRGLSGICYECGSRQPRASLTSQGVEKWSASDTTRVLTPAPRPRCKSWRLPVRRRRHIPVLMVFCVNVWAGCVGNRWSVDPTSDGAAPVRRQEDQFPDRSRPVDGGAVSANTTRQ